MNIYLETMGCQMNRLDSELVTGSLRAAGHTIVDDPHAADVLVYNTCSVRRHAEQKVLSRLGADGQRKASGRKLLLVVIGCMAQRMGETLPAKYPQVDVVCSPGKLHLLPQLIADAAARSSDVPPRPVVVLDPARNESPDTASEEHMDELDLSHDPAATQSRSQAMVRVARGCDFFCSYCIVPFVRGPVRSREPRQIADEVRRLVDGGKTEITLLGQTVNSYRWSDGERQASFAELLAMVSGISGLKRLRFVTSHPIDFGDDVLHAMRDLPNVCPYIHVPAQSGSDTVLKRMNRKYTRAEYDDLIDRARAIVPGVVLAGDFIVGFPGETEEDHAASAELIRRCGYKNSFIFKYSPRPGTIAAKRFEDDIPVDVKKRRNNELLAVQAEVGLVHHRGYIGQTVEVLVEGPSPRAKKQSRAARPGWTQLVGRTTGDHIVLFDGPESLADQYVNVRVASASALSLMGEMA